MQTAESGLTCSPDTDRFQRMCPPRLVCPFQAVQSLQRCRSLLRRHSTARPGHCCRRCSLSRSRHTVSVKVGHRNELGRSVGEGLEDARSNVPSPLPRRTVAPPASGSGITRSGKPSPLKSPPDRMKSRANSGCSMGLLGAFGETCVPLTKIDLQRAAAIVDHGQILNAVHVEVAGIDGNRDRGRR